MDTAQYVIATEDSTTAWDSSNTTLLANDGRATANPLSTWQIAVIAICACIFITAVLVLLVIWKWRRRSPVPKEHDESNGAVHEPLFNNKLTHPEIVITEPTMCDTYSISGQGSSLEVYSSKSMTHVPPCSLAVLEDLDESELISPAFTENNLRMSPGLAALQRAAAQDNNESTTAVAQKASSSSSYRDIAMISSPQSDTTFAEIDIVVDEDRAFPGRTQSISSTSSLKMDRPAYAYSINGAHGMSPYGTADHISVPDKENDVFGIYTVNQVVASPASPT